MEIPGARLVGAPRDPDEPPERSTSGAADVPRVDAAGVVAPEESSPIPGARRATMNRGPSFSERAGALLEGAKSGLADAAPLVAGGVGGAAGFVAGGPPGAFAGGALAFEAARQAARPVAANVPTIEEVDPALRPFRYAGEVLGGGAPIAAAPIAAVRTGLQRAAPEVAEAGGTLFRRLMTSVRQTPTKIANTARDKPGTLASAEAAALVSSAAGEGVAEAVDPGDTSTRILTGIGAGTLSPGALVVAGSSAVGDSIKRAGASLTRAGLENRAAAELGRIAADMGEDSAQIAAALRAARAGSGAGDTRTAAQSVSSPTLAALEAELTRRSGKFGNDSRESARQALESYRDGLAVLESSGDPGALREAAVLRQRYFDDVLSSTVASAEADLAEVAARMGPSTLESGSQLSARGDAIIGGALKKARDAERELWAAAPRATPTPGDGTLAAINRASADMLPGTSLPPVVTAFAKFIKQGGQADAGAIVDTAGRSILGSSETAGSIPLDRMLKFRSEMLNKAREADANFSASEARLYGQLAEAALDDMLKLGLPELEAARTYSRTLNDVFTRSFAGQAVSTGRGGAERVPPEVLLRRSIAGGREAGALRLKQLNEAVAFGDPEAGVELASIQENFLRRAAAEIVDPETGLPSAAKLKTFNRTYGEAIAEMGLKDDLANTQAARTLFDETMASTKSAQRAIAQRTAFARLANTENPTEFVGRMLAGDKPKESMRQLAALARRDGPAATAGLKRAVFEDAFARAGGNTDSFSFTTYRRMLQEPRKPGQPSTLDLMKANGILDPETAKRLNRLLEEADRVEDVLQTRPELEEMLAGESALFDLVLRGAGAKLGSEAAAASGAASGASLVAAGAGSRFLRQTMSRVPQGRVQDVLIEAAENPAMMSALLERATTPSRKIELAKKLNAYLIQAGLVDSEEQAGNE